jgi:hypothetical protein
VLPSDAPLVSIVLTGRNDGYGGDFLTRFFRTLRFNHQQLTARGIRHEFVFVEWAPLPFPPRISSLVFDAVPELEPAVCTWYAVDPLYQRVLSLNPRLAYLEFAAKNVGIRRARGRFLLTTNCDVFLGRHILDTLSSSMLDCDTVYRASRHDLKAGIDQAQIDWSVLEDPRNLARPAGRLKPPLMLGGTGDFVLLDASRFRALGGFNEVYRVARIGIDHNFVVKALSSGLKVEDIGGPVYHVNHAGSFRVTRDEYKGREQEAPWGNERWHSKHVVYSNPPTWGLADAPVRQERDGCWYLEFSWAAVPPLVDLKRVVLPVARLGRPAPQKRALKA